VDLEQIVQQILLTRRDLSREEVLKKIYEKKRSAEDYFLDEVAAKLVASELGVEIPRADEAIQGAILIKDLVSGLNDVSITGRLIIVYPPQTFSRSDMTEGKVARLLLADKTGSLRLVLWDDKIELVEAGTLRQGQIIKALHAYVREGFDGKLELHLGKKGELQIQQDLNENNYPMLEDFIDRIGKLSGERKRVNVEGLISQAFPTSEFKRPNGNLGKVKRMRFTDATGQITVVFWNERVDEMAELKEGDCLRIMNARTKTQPDGGIELQIENSTQIEKIPCSAPTSSMGSFEGLRKIVDLKEEGGPFTLEATVALTPTLREVTTSQEETIVLASFELIDETGKIGITLWRKQAELSKELAVGTRLRLRNVYVKRGFSNMLELSSRSSTIIEIVSKAQIPETQSRLDLNTQ
jgi:replication factor A1